MTHSRESDVLTTHSLTSHFIGETSGSPILETETSQTMKADYTQSIKKSCPICLVQHGTWLPEETQCLREVKLSDNPFSAWFSQPPDRLFLESLCACPPHFLRCHLLSARIRCLSLPSPYTRTFCPEFFDSLTLRLYEKCSREVRKRKGSLVSPYLSCSWLFLHTKSILLFRDSKTFRTRPAFHWVNLPSVGWSRWCIWNSPSRGKL